MKKIYFFIVALLALVIFASGCTQTNQTNQSSVGNYSVNGISFNFPLDWVLSGTTRGNISSINIIDQEFLQSNQTKGDVVSITRTPKTTNITYENVKKSITNSSNVTYNTTNGTINIAGLTGNLTTFTTNISGNETQIKLIYFEKDNLAYILSFYVVGGANIQDQQKYFDVIINSFKV